MAPSLGVAVPRCKVDIVEPLASAHGRLSARRDARAPRWLRGRPLACAGGVQVPVDGGARDVDDVCDLLDGAFAGVLGVSDLFGVSLGRRPPVRPRAHRRTHVRPRARAAASPSRVVATRRSRCSSASTESIPNIARPSAVVVSMPWSMTCRLTPRSRRSAPSVTRCRTERPRRSSRVVFSVSPSRRRRRMCRVRGGWSSRRWRGRRRCPSRPRPRVGARRPGSRDSGPRSRRARSRAAQVENTRTGGESRLDASSRHREGQRARA